MSEIKISELTANTAPVSADVFPMVETATTTTKKVTLANLVTSIASFVKTLTNTTFDTAGAGNTFKVNGTSITDKTGTGKVVLDTSPTIATPTLTAPIFSTVTNTGTLTLPTSTDTLVGRATTDTLTNKTLTTPTIADLTNATHTHQNNAGGGQLNATSVFSAGTVPTARLGSGTANNTTFLRGDQTWQSFQQTYAYGDGSDGAANFDGTNTFSFASKSGNTYTLTRDVYLTDITIGAVATLKTGGYRIYANGTSSGSGILDFSGNAGTAGNNGVAGSNGGAGGAGGTAVSGYFSNVAGVAGGAGGFDVSPNGTNGTAGTGTTNSVGVAGVAGGAGAGAGAGSGGAAGAITAVLTKLGVFALLTLLGYDFNTTAQSVVWKSSAGSGGGGGGKGNSTGASAGGGGGGAGASGGIILFVINTWGGSFTINVAGGTGGAGGNASGVGASGGGGGGGGGAGGTSIVVYNTKTWTGSYTLTGGTGGAGGTGVAGGGTGTTGTTGTTGVSYELPISNLTR